VGEKHSQYGRFGGGVRTSQQKIVLPDDLSELIKSLKSFGLSHVKGAVTTVVLVLFQRNPSSRVGIKVQVGRQVMLPTLSLESDRPYFNSFIRGKQHV
jgi:hypothetical protein